MTSKHTWELCKASEENVRVMRIKLLLRLPPPTPSQLHFLHNLNRTLWLNIGNQILHYFWEVSPIILTSSIQEDCVVHVKLRFYPVSYLSLYTQINSLNRAAVVTGRLCWGWLWTEAAAQTNKLCKRSHRIFYTIILLLYPIILWIRKLFLKIYIYYF